MYITGMVFKKITRFEDLTQLQVWHIPQKCAYYPALNIQVYSLSLIKLFCKEDLYAVKYIASLLGSLIVTASVSLSRLQAFIVGDQIPAFGRAPDS